MAFEGLSEKLNATFKHLRGKGRLSEEDIKLAMREVRLALLEADVSYKVVKDFVKTVSERAVGAEVLDSLTPAQQVIKIVSEELTALMDTEALDGGESATAAGLVAQAQALTQQLNAYLGVLDVAGRILSRDDADAAPLALPTELPQQLYAVLSSAYAELVAQEPQGKQAQLTVSPATRDLRAGFVLQQGDIEVNCAVETIAELCRSDLAAQVAEVLFGA